MCGIVGYIGQNQATSIISNGLSKLEYRGYDSAGIAVFDGEHICTQKAAGRLAVLEHMTKGGATGNGTGMKDNRQIISRLFHFLNTI